VKIADLQIGDELEDYLRGRQLVVTAIVPFSGGGNGEIAFNVVAKVGLVRAVMRRETLTFREFERLQFIRRPLHVSSLGDKP
jgi:hypothetical protein